MFLAQHDKEQKEIHFQDCMTIRSCSPKSYSLGWLYNLHTVTLTGQSFPSSSSLFLSCSFSLLYPAVQYSQDHPTALFLPILFSCAVPSVQCQATWQGAKSHDRPIRCPTNSFFSVHQTGTIWVQLRSCWKACFLGWIMDLHQKRSMICAEKGKKQKGKSLLAWR